MIIDGNHITAEGDKVLRRISSGEYYGKEMFLGYSHYIGGVLQDPPHLDVPADFEEVDSPEEISDAEALHIILGHE